MQIPNLAATTLIVKTITHSRYPHYNNVKAPINITTIRLKPVLFLTITGYWLFDPLQVSH